MKQHDKRHGSATGFLEVIPALACSLFGAESKIKMKIKMKIGVKGGDE
jgi:Na+/serine symporter